MRGHVGRWLWLCPLVSVVMAAVLLFVFGLSVWAAAAVAVLVGCPMAVGLVLVTERVGCRWTRGEQGK
jgi:hypothetical protein